MKDEINVANIVRKYFPDATDDEVNNILWEKTGYPCFWETSDIEACLRKQLEDLLLELKVRAHELEIGGE